MKSKEIEICVSRYHNHFDKNGPKLCRYREDVLHKYTRQVVLSDGSVYYMCEYCEQSAAYAYPCTTKRVRGVLR